LRTNNPDKYIIANGIITDGAGYFLENGAILIENDRIAGVLRTEEIIEVGVDYIDVGGRLIIPGLLNAHHHLYSTFAAGLSPIGETNSFAGILENLWWRLDRALDEESVYYSALLGLIDSIKHGVTTIFDHHASMNFVGGSLSVIEDAFKLTGIKGLLCFETSDRMGETDAESHIAENIDFYEKHRDSETLKGSFGLHANLTLSEKTLEKIHEAKPPEMPIHVHCGEDRADLEYCIERGYKGPIDRLNSFGLVSGNSILAHCIHLGKKDYGLIDEISPIIVSNSESNANNRVGKMDRRRIKDYILGSDGMTGDIIGTLRSHYLLGEGSAEDFDELRHAFFDYRYEIQRRFFPDTASFTHGSRADIAVLDYIPVTPINPDNLMGHLIFGAKSGKVYMTISDGKILYRNGKITFIDEMEITEKAHKVASKLHRRYYG